jgi:hypothetical protein
MRWRDGTVHSQRCRYGQGDWNIMDARHVCMHITGPNRLTPLLWRFARTAPPPPPRFRGFPLHPQPPPHPPSPTPGGEYALHHTRGAERRPHHDSPPLSGSVLSDPDSDAYSHVTSGSPCRSFSGADSTSAACPTRRRWDGERESAWPYHYDPSVAVVLSSSDELPEASRFVDGPVQHDPMTPSTAAIPSEVEHHASYRRMEHHVSTGVLLPSGANTPLRRRHYPRLASPAASSSAASAGNYLYGRDESWLQGSSGDTPVATSTAPAFACPLLPGTHPGERVEAPEVLLQAQDVMGDEMQRNRGEPQGGRSCDLFQGYPHLPPLPTARGGTAQPRLRRVHSDPTHGSLLRCASLCCVLDPAATAPHGLHQCAQVRAQLVF